MRRLFWVGVGAGLAVVVYVKGRELMHRATPAGIAEEAQKRASGLLDRATEFMSAVTEAMAEREAELNAEIAAQRAQS